MRLFRLFLSVWLCCFLLQPAISELFPRSRTSRQWYIQQTGDLDFCTRVLIGLEDFVLSFIGPLRDFQRRFAYRPWKLTTLDERVIQKMYEVGEPSSDTLESLILGVTLYMLNSRTHTLPNEESKQWYRQAKKKLYQSEEGPQYDPNLNVLCVEIPDNGVGSFGTALSWWHEAGHAYQYAKHLSILKRSTANWSVFRHASFAHWLEVYAIGDEWEFVSRIPPHLRVRLAHGVLQSSRLRRFNQNEIDAFMRMNNEQLSEILAEKDALELVVFYAPLHFAHLSKSQYIAKMLPLRGYTRRRMQWITRWQLENE